MQMYKKEYTNKLDGVTIPLNQNFANALLDVKGNNDYKKMISEQLIQNDQFLETLYKAAKDGFDFVIFDFSIWLSKRDYIIQTEENKLELCKYVTTKLNDILGLRVEYSIDDKNSTDHIIFNIMFKPRLIAL